MLISSLCLFLIIFFFLRIQSKQLQSLKKRKVFLIATQDPAPCFSTPQMNIGFTSLISTAASALEKWHPQGNLRGEKHLRHSYQPRQCKALGVHREGRDASIVDCFERILCDD